MSSCTHLIDKLVIACEQFADRTIAACNHAADTLRDGCDHWVDQGYSACSNWADQGYSSCSSWSKSCRKWLPWPLSYLCKLTEWVCKAWVWVAKWVCTATVWVSNLVCYALDIVAIVLRAACTIVMLGIQGACVLGSWGLWPVCWTWDAFRCAMNAIVNVFVSLFRPPSSKKIKHVFVLMLENRSFDHMLGLSELRGVDAETGEATTSDDLINNRSGTSLDIGGVRAIPGEGADWAVKPGPGHEFDDILEQLTGRTEYQPGAYPPITNAGYVANYVKREPDNPAKVMAVFAPSQLRILNKLAREFAVCDRWFSSLPGPTCPNRLFVHAASSAGLDDSFKKHEIAEAGGLDGVRFDNGTVFDRLEDRCLDWLIFRGDHLPAALVLSGMAYRLVASHVPGVQGKIPPFSDFKDAVNDPSYSAAYTFIEPDYGDLSNDYMCGNSQHPTDDVARGERLIKDVYEAIRNSPLWKSSLLIVTYDEHGGFFDHAIPPQTVHPGDSVTRARYNHHNFDFKQLGPRVPAVVISPYIPRGTIDHKEHDHTAVIKTLCEIFGLSPLTKRDRSTNSLTHLLSLRQARDDTPTQLEEVANSGLECVGGVIGPSITIARAAGLVPTEEAEAIGREASALREKMQSRKPEGADAGFLYAALLALLRVSPGARRADIIERFGNIESLQDAQHFLREARSALDAYELFHPSRRRWRPASTNAVAGNGVSDLRPT